VHGRLCVLGRVLACEQACVVGRSTVFGRAETTSACAVAGFGGGGGHALVAFERDMPLPIAPPAD
jgi:hypothetical protein